jgi:hypothetical protein
MDMTYPDTIVPDWEPPDINSPNDALDWGSYTSSIPDTNNNSLGGVLNQTLSSLLNFQLNKAKVDAQTQVATAARTVYPYGTNPLTGAPNTAANTNLVKIALIGAVIFVGLKFAKEV